MKLFKWTLLLVGALVPVSALAEQVASVEYNPSPLGIYNQLKIKDTATFRGALDVDELQLGKNKDSADGTIHNRVVIATQRDADGTIRLSDVAINKFTFDETDHQTANLNFPQATMLVRTVSIHNGGLFDADAGYSRTRNGISHDIAQVTLRKASGYPDYHIPVYADTVVWRSGSKWLFTPADDSLVGTNRDGDTTSVGGSGLMLDGVQIPVLPLSCTDTEGGQPTRIVIKTVNDIGFVFLHCP